MRPPSRIISRSLSESEISVLKSIVESVLTKNGYESIKTLTDKWQDNKLLLCEKDRAYKRVKLSKDLPPQPCYVFRLSTDSSEHITVKPDFESVSSDKLDDVDIRF